MAISVTDLPEKYQRQVMEKVKQQNDAKKLAVEAKKIADKVRNEEKKISKGNKLHAEKTNGYASKLEAKRAAELHLLEQAGEIQNLKEQVKFELIPAKWEEIPQIGKRGKPIKPKRKCVERAVCYYADFVYEKDGQKIVEDTKGYKHGATYEVFVLKRKMMMEIFGIKVIEVSK